MILVRHKIWLAAVGSAALTTGLLAAAAAPEVASAATVPPVTVITSNGEAGFYSGMNDPGRFKTIKATFYLRKAIQTIGVANGGVGIQLGNDSTGRATQMGAIWNPPACPGQVEVGYGTGTLAATPGTNTTAINSGGRLAPLHLSPILCAPLGHYVKVNLTEVSPGVYEAFGKDITANFSASKAFSGLPFPDEASAGVVADLSSRSAPASIKLVHFGSISVKNSTGTTAGLGGTSAWTPVGVGSNPSGNSGNPLLVTPDSLVNTGTGINRVSSFNVFVGAQTGP
jgi:hypothetical protein